VMAPNGVPCCDISDGHRTSYDVRQGAYWVPIEGRWMAVPERAVIRDRGNRVNVVLLGGPVGAPACFFADSIYVGSPRSILSC